MSELDRKKQQQTKQMVKWQKQVETRLSECHMYVA